MTLANTVTVMVGGFTPDSEFVTNRIGGVDEKSEVLL